MADKCRRRMNGGEGYITTEISQREGGGGRLRRRRRPRKRKEAPRTREELRILVLGRGVPSS